MSNKRKTAGIQDSNCILYTIIRDNTRIRGKKVCEGQIRATPLFLAASATAAATAGPTRLSNALGMI